MRETERRFLRALYLLHCGQASFDGVAAAANLTGAETVAALESLDRAGYLDAERMQFTMLGFAMAARLDHLARIDAARRGERELAPSTRGSAITAIASRSPAA